MRVWLVCVVAVVLGGCGATQEEVAEQESLRTQTQELVCCEQTCPGGGKVSCCSDGGYCFAKDGVAVVCDGVAHQCPPTTEPPPGCTINGVNYAYGAVHPSNVCLICDPSQSTTAWSNNDNFTNNNGFCSEDTGLCTSGFCKGWGCSERVDCGGHCLDGQRVCGY
jgi:hypothetical protein